MNRPAFAEVSCEVALKTNSDASITNASPNTSFAIWYDICNHIQYCSSIELIMVMVVRLLEKEFQLLNKSSSAVLSNRTKKALKATN